MTASTLQPDPGDKISMKDMAESQPPTWFFFLFLAVVVIAFFIGMLGSGNK